MAYTPTNWVNGETPINADNLNKIEQELLKLDNKMANVSGSVMDITESGIYYVTTSATDKPTTVGGLLLVAYGSANTSVRLFIPADNAKLYVRRVYNGNDNGWQQL